jgi:hypothetical protein
MRRFRCRRAICATSRIAISSQSPARVFVRSKNRTSSRAWRFGSKFLANGGLRDGFGVGTQIDHEGASMAYFIHTTVAGILMEPGNA